MKKVSFESLTGLHKNQGGLSLDEIARQRARFGSNEIIEVSGHPLLELFLDTIKDPMIWFLLGIGLIFIFTGDTGEGLILFAAILPLVLMDTFLHWRTQASTAGLRSQLNSFVTVLRDSKNIEINSHELVPGDLVLISAGGFVPADGVFAAASSIQVDESALTGEAFPVQKKFSDFNPFEMADAGEVEVSPEVLGYAGTRVLTGTGQMRVLLTGKSTLYGEIVQSVAAMPHERTDLQKSISRLVRQLVIGAALFCLLLAAVRMYQGHGWLDALLSAATLAVAAIPEEFPVVFTFFLGVGIYRLAKKRALVRRAVSVENIGRITQICTDKTGTITRGELELTHLDPFTAITANDLLAVALAASNQQNTDPVDRALKLAATEKNISAEVLRVMPFTEDRKRETGFVKMASGEFMAMTKGSPETVLLLSVLSDAERREWNKKTQMWARAGHKVLACARKNILQNEFDLGTEPDSGFEFCGLLAFEDPPRPEVKAAMNYCRQNGIRVMMITGDHPETAAAIATEAGLTRGVPRIFSAEAEPEKLEQKYLSEHAGFLQQLEVVARCTPLQKLKIVQALKAAGEVVAVTGDGVNDVPALKVADIGIAMGERGTRSAKEVSSIILADDNFSTIVNAIMEGRQLFKNLKMSFEYLLLFHLPFVLTAALIPLMGYPLLYLPVHIVWLELIIHPTALLAFQDPATPESTRARNQVSFFTRREGLRLILLGLALTVVLAFSFVAGMNEGSHPEHGRAKALALLIFWSAGLVIYFSKLQTGSARLIVAITLLSGVFLIQSPWTAQWLHVTPLHLMDWIEITAIAVIFVTVNFLLSRKIAS